MPNDRYHRARVSGWVPEGAARVPAHALVEELLDDIEYRFRLAGQGPAPLSVDGRRLGHGLPRRLIALPELSAVLMHPSCGFDARDAVWRYLVAQARTGDEKWVVGAVGVALPGLRYKAYLLSLHSRGDVQAALVAEFVKALATVDVDRPSVISALLSAAFSAARTELRRQEPAEAGKVALAPGPVLPPSPSGHPDFVLARAVQRGVLSKREADIIGATRLEHLTVAQYALLEGLSRWQVYRLRRPAETRLAEAIAAGILADPHAEVIAEATLTTSADTAHTWRQH